MKGKLALIIGPSGVGKSVIFKALKRKHGSTGLTTGPEFHFPHSATTRPKRPGEKGDVYQFVTDVEFDRLLKEGKFLEWAVIHGSARYGTLIEEIIPPIEAGKTVIREVDVQGFDSIRTHKLFQKPDAPYHLQSIFILPENREQLIERITHRAPISDDELKRRIVSMDKEMTYADFCDIKILNKNGELPASIRAVEKAILE